MTAAQVVSSLIGAAHRNAVVERALHARTARQAAGAERNVARDVRARFAGEVRTALREAVARRGHLDTRPGRDAARAEFSGAHRALLLGLVRAQVAWDLMESSRHIPSRQQSPSARTMVHLLQLYQHVVLGPVALAQPHTCALPVAPNLNAPSVGSGLQARSCRRCAPHKSENES